MQSGAHGEIQWPDAFDDRLRAPDRASGAVEGGEEAVARRIDLASVEARELATNGGVVLLHEIAPATVSDLRRALRRSDEIGEENRREHPIGGAGLALSR